MADAMEALILSFLGPSLLCEDTWNVTPEQVCFTAFPFIYVYSSHPPSFISIIVGGTTFFYRIHLYVLRSYFLGLCE
jgi:hypothetical protein